MSTQRSKVVGPARHRDTQRTETQRTGNFGVADPPPASSRHSHATRADSHAPRAEPQPARSAPDGHLHGRVDRRALVGLIALAGVCALMTGPLVPPGFAQQFPVPMPAAEAVDTSWSSQLFSLHDAAIRLPVAAVLSTVLAYRPRRQGTPKRQLAVIQTQIILAIVGAIVMLVVGASLARAFGIVGAAGLIRYRAKVEDPKDAGVMLCTLAVGLASGVGQYAVAVFATAFVLLALWLLESLEPAPYAVFGLAIVAKETPEMKTRLERVLRRHHVRYELRGTSPEELAYEVKVPLDQPTDAISESLVSASPHEPIEVKWDKKKDK